MFVKYDLPPKGISYKQWRKQILQRAIGGSLFIFGILGLFVSLFLLIPEKYNFETINLSKIDLPVSEKYKSFGIEGTIISEADTQIEMFGTNTPVIKGSIILKLKQGSKEEIIFKEKYQAEKLVLTADKKRLAIKILPKNIATHEKISKGKISFSNKNGKIIPVKANCFDTAFVITGNNWNENVELIIIEEYLNSGEQVVLSGNVSDTETINNKISFSNKNAVITNENTNRIVLIIITITMTVFGFVLYRKGTRYRLQLINHSESIK